MIRKTINKNKIIKMNNKNRDIERKKIAERKAKAKKKEEKKNKVVKKWKSCLKNIPCFIIGNAPSLNKELPEGSTILDDRFTIGINRSFLRIDCTMLVWQDASLWYLERKRVVKQKSINLCRDRADPENRFYHFKLSLTNWKLSNSPIQMYGRGNSGPIAYQLAYSLGCDPIVLVGMDCTYKKSKTNFYGKNPQHRSHTLISCKSGLKWMRKCALKHESKREIISCSRDKVFENKKSLEETLEYIGDKGKGSREYFKNILLKGKEK